MERTTDLVKPYRLQLVHDEKDVLVGVNIRTEDGEELDLQVIRSATTELLNHFRRQRLELQRASGETQPPLFERPTQVTPHQLKTAYDDSRGELSEKYLALVSLAYAEMLAAGRDPIRFIASAIREAGAPPVSSATVRSHVKRAREEGYLTPTRQGKASGEVTEKTRQELRASAET